MSRIHYTPKSYKILSISNPLMSTYTKIGSQMSNRITGADGLVAARHLWHYGYKPTVYYPKRSKNELYKVRFSVGPLFWGGMCGERGKCAQGADSRNDHQRLATQLENLGIPFVDDFPHSLTNSDHVVDAIFGA